MGNIRDDVAGTLRFLNYGEIRPAGANQGNQNEETFEPDDSLPF